MITMAMTMLKKDIVIFIYLSEKENNLKKKNSPIYDIQINTECCAHYCSLLSVHCSLSLPIYCTLALRKKMHGSENHQKQMDVVSPCTEEHTWFNYTVHIFYRGQYRRGTIKTLEFHKGYIGIRVYIESMGESRLFHPISIVAWQSHWLACDFVSEDECDTTTIFKLLPAFRLLGSNHDPRNKKVFKWLSNQTDNFQLSSAKEHNEKQEEPQ